MSRRLSLIALAAVLIAAAPVAATVQGVRGYIAEQNESPPAFNYAACEVIVPALEDAPTFSDTPFGFKEATATPEGRWCLRY